MYDTTKLCLWAYLMMSFEKPNKTRDLKHCLEQYSFIKDTTPEWEHKCMIYLRLSSRHCKLLFLSHQPWQLLATIRWLTYCTCEAGCPDCHAKGKAQSNSHSLEPLYTFVNGGSWSTWVESTKLTKRKIHIILVLNKKKIYT